MNIEDSIEILKNSKKLYLKEKIDSDILEEAIETLLTAYEKEKETSHYIQSQLDIANAKLIEEKEKNKDLKEGYKIQEHNYQVAMEEIEQRWEDKIKAKIEELEKQDRESRMSHNYLVIPVLQSLLEKE